MVVTLSSDTFENAWNVGQPEIDGVREIAAKESPVAAENETVAAAENPDNAEVPAEEKPAAVPEEKKAIETPRATDTVPQGPVQGEKLNPYIVIHTRAFVESAARSIQKALQQEIAGDSSGGLNEGTAQITFHYDDKGGIGEVWGSAESEKLKSVLARFDWQSVPSPGAFRLRMQGLLVTIKIEKGEPALFFTAL